MTPPLPASANRKVFIACFATFCINGAVALSVGSLLPYLRGSFALDYALAGLLVSLHSVGNLVSSFVAGLLPIWIGRRKSIALFNVLAIASFVIMAVCQQPLLLLPAFFMTGLGRGAVSNFNNSVISEVAPGKAWALNTLHASFAVGAFLAPFAVLVFSDVPALGWRFFCWFMVVLTVIELVFYLTMPIPPRPQKANRERGGGILFLRTASFWLGTGTLFFYLCAEQGVIGWMVTYFKDSGLMSSTYAQSMASILWILILFGRLSAAWLSLRMRRGTLLAIMGIGMFTFFLVLLLGRSLPVITIGVMGFGFSMAGVYPTTVALSGDVIGTYPLAWSFMLTMAGIGAIVMPSIIGTIADRAGIYAGISSIVVALVLAVVLIATNAIYRWRTGQ